MNTSQPKPPVPRSKSQPTPASYRSGAVARMLRMPVATLRVWERRYGVAQPALSASGQRLYSADDVRRLALVKQLTDLGHAIGSLATLGMAQLQQVAATHATAVASTQPARRSGEAPVPQSGPWRLAVVGAALGSRLRRSTLLRQLGRPVNLLGAFDDVGQAYAALQGQPVDALLVHVPQLHADWLASVQEAAPGLADVPKAVLYGYAADAVCVSLAEEDVALLRGPQPDVVIAQWLRSLAALPPGMRGVEDLAGPAAAAAPRRWDDAALAEIAGLSSTVACECPRHVAELLIQLSHFEAYSAQCEHRSPVDAELHAYLGRVAVESRARFETALEQVALHEGLLLPASLP